MNLQSVLAITVAGTGLLIGTGILKLPKIEASVYSQPLYERTAQLPASPGYRPLGAPTSTVESSPGYQPLGAPSSIVDRIEVSLADRTASVYRNGTMVRTYPIGIGSPSTPTPKGVFSILEKEVNPVYFNSEGRQIPLGSRWIAFLEEGDDVWGFHGGDLNTESLGCIHMLEPDLQELYEIVPVGTRVSIR